MGEVPDSAWSDVPGVIRIHHVGIVVRDAEEAAETYARALGLEPIVLEDYREVARVAFLRAGETLLELIQPVTEGTLWSDALRDRGEGVHHLALEVIDLRTAMTALEASGVGTLASRPQRAPGDTLSIYLDPAATGGTLIELVQQIRA
ncbi:MAG TPA: VOC family protein [bacterium]|nr:VOC family protein [bacterium]